MSQLPESSSSSLNRSRGNKIYLTLWDDYARQFNEYVELNKEANRLVIILQHGRLSYFKDKPYVSNNYSVTRLFINDHEKSTPDFKLRQLPADSSNES
ncbi:hypothetical protein QVD17_19473 [Tagetes erecta]|uniref:Uncharacterized protein n=1 Tax=Tagetes erecta TaxID=13708 RepID=A0AAD8KJG5_TARER|nr:hypothetical protein QVD17_19473 [Tagetes erecta]